MKLIGKYFDEISLDSAKFYYGIDDTLEALEANICETLIVFKNLEVTRWAVKTSTGSGIVLHINQS